MISTRERFFLALLLLATCALLAEAARHTPAYTSMDRKISTLESNADNQHAQPQTTVLTQDELNAYFREGGVQIPKGLSDVRFNLREGVVRGSSKVDFDTLAAGHGGGNPLYSILFTGTHDVDVDARASGSGGHGTVTVQTVKLDGVEIPKSALEYLIRYYVRPRYPQVGMTSVFKLPAKIDSAQIQQGRVTLTQK